MEIEKSGGGDKTFNGDIDVRIFIEGIFVKQGSPGPYPARSKVRDYHGDDFLSIIKGLGPAVSVGGTAVFGSSAENAGGRLEVEGPLRGDGTMHIGVL